MPIFLKIRTSEFMFLEVIIAPITYILYQWLALIIIRLVLSNLREPPGELSFYSYDNIVVSSVELGERSDLAQQVLHS